jgi:hypothetical protein
LADRSSAGELRELIAGTPGKCWQDLVALAEIAQQRDGSAVGNAAANALVAAVARFGVEPEASRTARRAQARAALALAAREASEIAA